MAGYEIPVGTHGTKIGFDYSASAIKMGKEYKTDDIRGYSSNYEIRITQPLYKNQNTDLIWITSFDAVNSRTIYNAAQTTLSHYNLRILKTGLYGLHDDQYGRWIGNLGSDFGIRFLGASPSIADGPSSNYVSFRAGSTRVQRLPNRMLGIARLSGQYSPNRLFASEQMQLGGPYSLRGYEPGALLGDLGVYGTLELRTPIPGLGKILPDKIKNWENKVQYTTFYDWGYVKDHNNLYGYPQHFLQNIGTGLHIYLTDYLSLAMNVGIPIGHKYYNENSVRFNFTLNSEMDKFFFKPVERL